MAKWSALWNTHNKAARVFALYESRFTSPSKPKKRTGGKYPHLQPFNANLRAGKAKIKFEARQRALELLAA